MLNVGIIEYINTLPLRQNIGELPQNRFSLTLGNPAQLNKKILTGELDVSLMSAFAFLENQDTLQRVPGIGIAAEKEVLSVGLVSRVPPSQLGDATVALTKQSASSVALTRVLLKHHFKSDPILKADVPLEQLHLYPAYLIIGDACLKDSRPAQTTFYDLATAWNQMTGLPFTFGVLACRKDLSPEKRALIPPLVHHFFRSIELSLENPESVVKQAKQIIPLPDSLLKRYYEVLEFALKEKHERGIAHFSTLCNELEHVNC